MAKYHHALSRRDFMKALGFGAAAGGALAAMPAFADLDDMMSTGATLDHSVKRAWYIKERPLGDTTTPTDWSAVKGHENNYILNSTNGNNYCFDEAQRAQISALNATTVRGGIDKGIGGFQTRDYALSASSGLPAGTEFQWNLPTTSIRWNTVAGLSKYTGTPEENSKMVRAAATFLGASSVGFAVLEGDEKKICNVVHSEGRPFVWENVEWPYLNAQKIVVPNNRTLYAIGIGEEFSKEMFRHENGNHGAGQLRGSANGDRYRRWCIVMRAIQTFLTYMGYIALGYPEYAARGLLPSGGDAILTGMAEGGRSSNNFISPEHGMAQGYFSIVTDMPLAPTAPIDAGIFRFCHTCRKCAESCPSEAIGFDKEPTYDLFDPNMYKFAKDKPVKFLTPGKKRFKYDAYACRYQASITAGCCNCMGTCTFNVNNGAGIHGMVKGMLATTSLFNGFLWKADKFYGFGLTKDENKADWWNMSMPVSGIDSTITARDGAYRKRAY